MIRDEYSRKVGVQEVINQHHTARSRCSGGSVNGTLREVRIGGAKCVSNALESRSPSHLIYVLEGCLTCTQFMLAGRRKGLFY